MLAGHSGSQVFQPPATWPEVMLANATALAANAYGNGLAHFAQEHHCDGGDPTWSSR